MLIANGLTKRYKKKLAVDDVSFKVRPGVVTGFLGPNGAGKTTTMRLILGLDKGLGETRYDGQLLREYASPVHVVGLLLDAKAFHPKRTARNHLRVLAAAGGIDDTRVDEVLSIVGLTDVADKRPGSFSMGMGQRLGIAAAILGKPKYLLLDEPGNGLDPEGISWLRRFMQDYAAAGNVVFVSSHLLSEMAQMATDVIVIGKGKLLADTSIEALISGSGATTTFVRVKAPKRLERALIQAGAEVENSNSGLLVRGLDIDAVGQLAFKLATPVLELSQKAASLEEVFLEITAGSEEYKAKVGADSEDSDV
ncbi:MAG: ATP-binding cassette domain-containing protein [Candidatus Saccharimonadales bacterium]